MGQGPGPAWDGPSLCLHGGITPGGQEARLVASVFLSAIPVEAP